MVYALSILICFFILVNACVINKSWTFAYIQLSGPESLFYGRSLVLKFSSCFSSVIYLFGETF
uniref:Uncharacterized protein n=1 Tax=Arundo donax TaxID=35708 RepID=A0A0A8XUL0_ARUDO